MELSIGSGFSNVSTGNFLSASVITAFQIGPARAAPPFFIGLLSLLPTQTPTATDGVYPIVQASLLSFVVPVLTATSLPATLKIEFAPKVGVLASLSDKILERIFVVFGLIISCGFSSNFSRTFPLLSSTEMIPV